MGTDVAVRQPQIVRLSNDQLKYIAHTEYVPKELRGNLPAIMACIATGREMGLGDMEAMHNIYVIDGRTSFAAELLTKETIDGAEVARLVQEGLAGDGERSAPAGDPTATTI